MNKSWSSITPRKGKPRFLHMPCSWKARFNDQHRSIRPVCQILLILPSTVIMMTGLYRLLQTLGQPARAPVTERGLGNVAVFFPVSRVFYMRGKTRQNEVVFFGTCSDILTSCPLQLGSLVAQVGQTWARNPFCEPNVMNSESRQIVSNAKRFQNSRTSAHADV